MNFTTHKLVTPLQQRILIFGGILLFVSFYFLRNIYIPIFVSYFLAFLLNPIVRKLEKKGFGRLGPIFLLLFLVFGALMVFAVLTLPRVISQLRELYDEVPVLMTFLSERYSAISLKYLGYDVFTQWKDLAHNLWPELGAFPAAGILESLFSGTIRAISTLLSVLMIPILTFYILKDYYVLNDQLLKIVPRRYVGDVQEVMRRLSIVLGALIRGQFLVCTILAAVYSITLHSAGLEMALLLGVFSGFMNLVPFVGPLVSGSLTLLIAILSGASFTQCAIIVGIYTAANLVDTTVLTPKIVGKQVGINSLTIILALLAGGELLGFLGILLALPITAMVKVLGGYLAERYYESPYYKEDAPLADRQSLSDSL